MDSVAICACDERLGDCDGDPALNVNLDGDCGSFSGLEFAEFVDFGDDNGLNVGVVAGDPRGDPGGDPGSEVMAFTDWTGTI